MVTGRSCRRLRVKVQIAKPKSPGRRTGGRRPGCRWTNRASRMSLLNGAIHFFADSDWKRGAKDRPGINERMIFAVLTAGVHIHRQAVDKFSPKFPPHIRLAQVRIVDA